MTDDQQRQEWLEWRRSGIGASDIAKAVTGKYGGRVGVVAEKLGIGTDDRNQAEKQRGHDLEQPLADAVLALFGYYVAGEQMEVTHPDRRRDLCTVDGFLSPYEPNDVGPTLDELDALLELKSSTLFQPIPIEYYETQTQWQMHVTGMVRALIAVAIVNDNELNPDHSLSRIEFYWVERNQDVINVLIGIADELWGYVEAGKMPEPTDGSALDLIRAANATADESAVVNIDDMADLIADHEDLKARAKAAEDRLKHSESLIRLRMGEATEAKTSDGRWRVRCGQPVRKWTDMARLELELFFPPEEHPDFYTRVLNLDVIDQHPELGERFKVPTPDRRLTIKEFTPHD